MRLLIVSNSSPAVSGADPADTATAQLRPDGAGGLVPHLTSLLAGTGGTWCFADPNPSTGRWPERVADVALRPVPVSRGERAAHYEQVAIDVLQRMFHYLHDTETAPVFDPGLHAAWGTYRVVNQRFADAVTAARPVDGTVVLINDYHLLLVPGMVRAAVGNAVRLVYSHGVPWCEPPYLATLPAAVRREILESLLAADTVVVHATGWRDALARCCARYVPGVEVTDAGMRYRGRLIRLAVVPFPLDAAAVDALANSAEVAVWRERLDREAAGRQVLARVDRLDLWKNHVRGFAAYGALLRRQPDLADDVWFLAVTTLPRYRSARHRAYEAACREAVTDLNDAFGRPGRPPVATLLEVENTRTARAPAVAALGAAGTVLVNPTYEGFSMVAKEAVLLSGTSTVLLSHTAGAYEQLAAVTVEVEPFDVAATTEHLAGALAGRYAPDPDLRAAWRRRIRSERSADWLAEVLGDDPP
jgi:trehalose 6-phosphate synthase